ncbi:MAG: sel1 repeat family protein [Rhodobacteraceae bacterium]|nr:MAG: sel1 repeat family protein [Paracoccaceae bacterium]
MRRARIVLALVLLLPQPVAAQLRAADGLAALEAGDIDGARAIWEPLAERGDLLSQYNLGVLELERDPEAARALFAAAAEQGHLLAQRALADLALEAGDWARARRWLRAVAQAGDAQAQMALAMMLDQGLGGPANATGAALWYGHAAEEGVAEAAFALGTLRLEAGDEAGAAKAFAQAAEAGHIPAQHNLALAYAQGRGVAQDPEIARALYFQAAQSGHAAAMHNLALMQARGQGGAQSFTRALAWALNARDAGHAQAEALVEALSEVMRAEAIAEAEALAGQCLIGAVCE